MHWFCIKTLPWQHQSVEPQGLPGCLNSGHQDLPNLEAMTNLYNLTTPPTTHLKPESDLTCGNTSSNPAAHQTKSTALPRVLHVDFLHRLVGSDPGHFSCWLSTLRVVERSFSLYIGMQSNQSWHLMAEKAICLCKPGTMPLYKAVRPSFLATETKVPSWEVEIVSKNSNVMDNILMIQGR